MITYLFFFFDEVRRMSLTKHQADAQITKERNISSQKGKKKLSKQLTAEIYGADKF